MCTSNTDKAPGPRNQKCT